MTGRMGNADSVETWGLDEDLTVVMARAPFMVVWTPAGLQLHAAGLATPLTMSAQDGRHLADLLTAAADFEEAA